MEDVLDVYKRPYDRRYPVVCMDEQPVQLLSHTRDPIPPKPGRAAREDHEYKREGVVAVLLFTEPLGAWRRVEARERRTKKDWAEEIKTLLDCDLKAGVHSGAPARNGKQLKKKILSHMRMLQKRPSRVRKYFKHGKVKYAA